MDAMSTPAASSWLPDEPRAEDNQPGPIGPGTEHPSTETLSPEAGSREPRTEQPRTEWPSTEALSPDAGSREPRSQQPRTEPIAASPTSALGHGSALGGLSASARALLANVPVSREGKGEWLRAIARNAEITLYLVRHLLKAKVAVVGLPFPCILHGDGCLGRLTTGRNDEIVYQDGVLAGTTREFQTIPELAVALLTGVPKRLRPLQHALWRLHMLHAARLIALPVVAVPQVPPDSPADVKKARDGFELLVRCRWFLDPGAPVAYTRSFVEAWCGLAKHETRKAVYELQRQGVIIKAGETTSTHQNPTYLYLPGSVFPVLGPVSAAPSADARDVRLRP